MVVIVVLGKVQLEMVRLWIPPSPFQFNWPGGVSRSVDGRRRWRHLRVERERSLPLRNLGPVEVGDQRPELFRRHRLHDEAIAADVRPVRLKRLKIVFRKVLFTEK